MMKALITCCTLLLIRFSSFAQGDTLTLNVEQLLQMVREFHPVVKQAGIHVDQSKADIMIARGEFNPVIGGYIANKTFANTNYYQTVQPSITLPTWFGIEVEAGMENLQGSRLDPTETAGQTSYIGLTVPVLKNLVMDKRRAFLQQSKLYRQMAETEQRATINNILMEAVGEYYEWVNAYQSYILVAKNEEISFQRFEMVKQAFFNGERPAIDTIEAQSQYQAFQFQKNEAWLQFINEGLRLSAYLWTNGNRPFQLPASIVPQKDWENEAMLQQKEPDLNELLSIAEANHPELQVYQQKLNILSINRKLKFQELLPKLDLTYNHLSKGYNALQTDGLLFRNNYQYAVKLSMPVPMSAGRGEYQKAKLKIDETTWDQRQKSLSISVKVKNYYNDFRNYKQQVILQQAMLENVERLLTAEETLFQNGESSVFLINARENKVLESKRKLAELKTKYLKSVYALQWSAGLLQ